MKKISFAILLTAYYLLLSSACEPGILDGGEEPPAIPSGGAKWDRVPDQRDGHYNVIYKITGSTCGEQYIPTYRGIWDFMSNGKNSYFFFDNDFPWYDADLAPNEQGEFQRDITSQTFLLFGRFWAYNLKMTGCINNGLLSADMVNTFLAGGTPELTAICSMTYKATGYKRYIPMTTAATDLEGEYKGFLTTKSSTCKSPTRYKDDYRRVFFLSNDDGTYDFELGGWSVKNFPIDDGVMDVSVTDDTDVYDFKGAISPETLKFTIRAYGEDLSCSEEYEVYGDKRFDEAGDGEKTLDGLYAVWKTPGKSTCNVQGFVQEKQTIDALDIGGGQVQLIVGGKIFLIKPDGKNFSGVHEGDSDYFKVTDTFAGTLDANAINGTLTTSLDWPQMKCFYSYAVSGYKLYRHN